MFREFHIYRWDRLYRRFRKAPFVPIVRMCLSIIFLETSTQKLFQWNDWDGSEEGKNNDNT